MSYKFFQVGNILENILISGRQGSGRTKKIIEKSLDQIENLLLVHL